MLISQRVAFFGFSSYVVLSGSMQPAIYPGDVIVVKKTNSQLLNKGDVVLFEDPKVAGKKITHRIVENKEKDGVKTYYTKGDANQDKDDWNISQNMVLGKVAFTIPKLGFLITFSKTPLGFAIFVLFPGMSIIFSEIAALVFYVKELEEKAKNVQVLS